MDKAAKEVLRDKEKLEKIYSKNGIYGTARILGVGLNTVRRWLDRNDIKRGMVILNGVGRDMSFMNSRKPTRFVTGGYEWEKEPGKKERTLHRIIMEKKLGRKLKKTEIVHHIDGNKLNNNEENLVLCISQKEHVGKLHKSMYEVFTKLYRLGYVGFDEDKKKYFAK